MARLCEFPGPKSLAGFRGGTPEQGLGWQPQRHFPSPFVGSASGAVAFYRSIRDRFHV